ncbi:hypothetical protein BTVI_60917 [Pitangus sulphuratus]|nr:hypothetical protein BTVI_60917 [Pitangus sulphuratus]
MSAQSKGTASSSSSPSEGPPAASKAKVKEQIKIIVEDLELVLGDLKDVAKELKENLVLDFGSPIGQDVSIWLSSDVATQKMDMSLWFSSGEGDNLGVFTCFLFQTAS